MARDRSQQSIRIWGCYLSQQGFEEGVMRLADHPVRVAGQGPAGDGAHQGLGVGQAAHQVGHQLRQVGHHACQATLCHGTQDQDGALLQGK